MRSTLLPFCVLAICFSLMVFAAPADAQCSANMLSFSDIGVVTNNPLQAEVVTTRSPTLPESLMTQYPELISRDSQGRIRTERVAGEFIRPAGPDAGTKAKVHLIVICDPVAQTTTQLDTMTLTAHIRRLPPDAPNSSRIQTTQHPFCSVRLLLNDPDHVDGVDLGVQSIQGLEAHGSRIHFMMPATSSADGIISDPPKDYVRETWCSDELSAVVGQVEASNDPAFGTTGAKLRDALASLDRASRWLLERVTSAPNDALAGATPYLRLFGSTLGGCWLAGEALAARADGDGERYVALARFFAENISVQAVSLEKTVTDSAEAVNGADAVLLA